MPDSKPPVMCPNCRKLTGSLLPPSPKEDGENLYFCTDCRTRWEDTDHGPVILTESPN